MWHSKSFVSHSLTNKTLETPHQMFRTLLPPTRHLESPSTPKTSIVNNPRCNKVELSHFSSASKLFVALFPSNSSMKIFIFCYISASTMEIYSNLIQSSILSYKKYRSTCLQTEKHSRKPKNLSTKFPPTAPKQVKIYLFEHPTWELFSIFLRGDTNNWLPLLTSINFKWFCASRKNLTFDRVSGII